MRKQRIVLKDGIHVTLPRRQLTGLVTVNGNRPAGKLLKSGDQPQAGGFAGAGRPQHGEKLAITDPHVDAVHRANVTIET